VEALSSDVKNLFFGSEERMQALWEVWEAGGGERVESR
jgi:hypothetical protein